MFQLGGQCQCKPHTTGRSCDTCERGYYNLSPSNPDGCESCGCNIAGIAGDVGCTGSGVCTCKPYVIGKCGVRLPNFWPFCQKWAWHAVRVNHMLLVSVGFDSQISIHSIKKWAW